MDQLLAFLQSISPLTSEVCEEIARIFRADALPAGSYFAEFDIYAREVAFLESGVVRAFFVNAEGKQYNKQFFVGPSFIGAYTSLLTATPNRIAQQALTDCVIWRADYEVVEKNYARYHDLERLGRKIAEMYFLEKEKKELEMALMEAEERYLIMRQQFPTIEQLIPQYHIASYLGISPTQLSRVRRKMAGA
ncbi:MAG: Crp/Fnr family transcriptional regulator [Bacteroidota bacterium]